ncbi:sulfite exporter TauE/SafE family protein, partial [Leptospira sp. SA-E8]|uniref:urease accessory protein UreH domain-containing protein n=1 Tax=Leptospira sp. SA-E8 TaxID=3422259 RepID=UPI003EB9C6C5
MQSSLALTAFLMGLAGGPHCVAMCGAACAGLTQAVRGGGAAKRIIGIQDGTPGRALAPSLALLLLFQAGRVLGYALLGALAAASMQGLGWLTIQSAALRPLWSLLHVAAVVLGLWLLWRAEQP